MPLWIPRIALISPRFSARTRARASSSETSVKTAISEPEDVPDALLALREALAALGRAAARLVGGLQLVRRRAGLGLHRDALCLAADPHLVDAVVLVLGAEVLDLLVLARVEGAFALDGSLGEGRSGAQDGNQEEAL